MSVNLQRVGGAGADANDVTTSLRIPTGKTLTFQDPATQIPAMGAAAQLVPEAFGAVGDGETDDTAALQLMLDAAAGGSGEGVEAYIPLGKTYRWSHILYVRSNTVLRWHGTLKMVDANAKQAGPFPVTGGYPPRDSAGNPSADFSTIGMTNSNGWQWQPEAPSGPAGHEEPYAVNENITIIGDGFGVLDGNIEGQLSTWFSSGNSGSHRGMDWLNVKNLHVSGIKIRGFTTFASLCSALADASFDRMVIDNSQITWRPGLQGVGQDGLHVARNCVRTKITRGKIKSSDDCVAVEVTSAGIMRDIVVDDMDLEVVSPDPVTDYATSARGVWVGRYFQAGFADSAAWYMRNISVTNIRVTGIGRAFMVNGGRSTSDIGKLSEVTFRNIFARDFTYNKDGPHFAAVGNAVAIITGTDNSTFDNINIRNFARGGIAVYGIRNTKLSGLRIRDQVDAGALWTTTTIRAAVFVCGPVAPTTYNSTTIRRTSNVATVETSAAHGLTPGDAVNVRGCVNNPSLNAESAVVTVLTTTSFSYPNTGSDIGANSDDTLARVTLDPILDIVGSEIELASVENIYGGGLHQHESVNATRIAWRDSIITAPRIANVGVGGGATDGYNQNMARAAIGVSRAQNLTIKGVRVNGVTGGFGVFVDKNRGGLTIDDCEVRDVCVGQNITRGRGVQIANVVGASASSSSVRRIGNIAVVTLTATHGFAKGDWVSIVGATTDTAFNQTLVQLNVVSSTVIRYDSTGSDVTSANGDDALLRITAVNLSANVRAITDNTAGNGMYFENVRELMARGRVSRYSVGSGADTGVDVALIGASGLNTTGFVGSVSVDVDCSSEAYGITARASALPSSVSSGNYAGSAISIGGTITNYATAEFSRGSDLGYSGPVLVRRASAAPSSGAWKVGDRCELSAPAAGGAHLQVCTTAGTPGTWKSAGNLAA